MTTGPNPDETQVLSVLNYINCDEFEIDLEPNKIHDAPCIEITPHSTPVGTNSPPPHGVRSNTKCVASEDQPVGIQEKNSTNKLAHTGDCVKFVTMLRTSDACKFARLVVLSSPQVSHASIQTF